MTARSDLCDKAVDYFASHGIGDTSLRTLAAAIGTSHRMLNYHFGSREGLLAAVVEAVERGEQAALLDIAARGEADAGWQFWTRLADRAQTFAPLFFEISTHAMRHQPHATGLRSWLSSGWVAEFESILIDSGVPRAQAPLLAHLCVATARGVLFELAVSGDRALADEQMLLLTQMVDALRDATPGAAAASSR